MAAELKDPKPALIGSGGMGEKRRPRTLVRGAYGKISMCFATVSG